MRPVCRSSTSNSPEAAPCAITSPRVLVIISIWATQTSQSLLHRDLDHLMQLEIADIALRVHAMDGLHQVAQAGAAGPGVRAIRWASSSTSPISARATPSWIAFFEIEEAIDVGGAHPQLFGDIGDRGLLVADLRGTGAPPPRGSAPGCRFRYVPKPASCVRLFFNVHLFGGFSKRKCGLCLAFMLRCGSRLLGRSRFLPGSCGTRGRRGPAGTARSGRLQQTNRP